jgi:hypothetical protein
VPAPALTAIAAFNLICTGTLRTGPLGLALPEAGGEPYTITYRIDLASNRWCSDECASLEPVVLVTDTEILLRESHVPSGGRTTIVGRVVGLFADTSIEGNIATLRSGRCEQGQFTGFPVRLAGLGRAGRTST